MSKRRGCAFGEGKFLPEESFQSWGSYTSALKDTKNRFRDRVLARSPVEVEINEIRARSGHEMKKTLNWWDLIWFGVGAIVGAGIFVLTGLEAKEDAGPAVLLSYVVSGISALLSVLCYTEFAVEIPSAGGSFAYLRVELGDFVAFIGAGNLILEYVVSGAAVARAWTSYLASLVNHHADDFRIKTQLSEGYNQLDPIAVAILFITAVIAIKSTKSASKINYIASAIHIVIILFVVIAGLTQAKASNYSDFMPYGVRGVFKAASVLFFAYVGFDAVSTLAEETKNPAVDIPVGLVGSMLVIITAYCLMAMTLCLMQNYKTIDTQAPFSIAFQQAGLGWAKYIVALGALKGMTTVLMVSVLGQARYLTHIARTHMFPPWFALVHEKTGTPINATVIMVVATAIIAFFTNLDILSNLLSISTLIIFSLIAIGLLVRRYYVTGETNSRNQSLFIMFLVIIIGSSIVTSIYWARSDGWIGYVITIPILFLGTLGLSLLVPQARVPKVWGVPLVPWIPALSVAVNIFLLGSIDNASFIRFSVWTAIILLYYFFFGLHASYDTAKVAEAERIEKGDNMVPS
ncbi:cationic amino acid transporter 1 [Cryptomeria japonica]|uniref:cationic amino acid transporter 1 n=1 Tax=Cryptomeria japonica TaxID=3369 RepID=UPI0025AD2483|nr:cationic amino acid transporter 1 [Cryptomeria japonica]XP_057824959.1 cationic amino acid transporter 1 [Cryptomeria japonica]